MSPFRTSLLFILVAVLGVASIFLIEVDFTPRSTSHSFFIAFSSDQRDPPLVTEQKVTSVLEGTLSAIPGIKEISSVSRFGGGSITLEFEAREDLQKKRMEILTALRQVRNQLPKNVPFPTITNGERGDREDPLLIYSLTSSLPVNEIEELASRLILPQIGLNPGIRKIELSTDSKPAVLLSYDRDMLHNLGFEELDLEQTIRSSFIKEQIGTITANGKTISLHLGTNPEDITDLLSLHMSKEVQIGDFASVTIDNLRPGYITRLNGANSVLIRIFAQEEENKLSLAHKLKSEVTSLQSMLPSGLEFILAYDDTEFISRELSKVSKRAGLSIIALSLLVLVVYRRFKQLVVLIFSVLVSICTSVLIMYLFKVSVHLYTIAGLTISFGLVIDNSIIVIDHLRRKKNLHVIMALLASSLTTIAALLVIFILPKEERSGMGDFASAISIALTVSVIVSLLFTPAISRLIHLHKGGKRKTVSKMKKWVILQRYYFRVLFFLGRYKKLIIGLLILFFGLPVYLVPKTIDGFSLYNRTVGADYYQEEIRPYSDKILGGMLQSFYMNVFESSGYRTPEKTQLYVSASLDEGHTIEQMNNIIRDVENFLDGIGGLDAYRTSIYSGTFARISIEFSESEENGPLPHILKNKLIQQSLDWGGVDWDIYGVGRGFSNATGESLPSFRVRLEGYNYEELEHQASVLAAKLLEHPRIKKVNTNDRISWRDSNTEQLMLKPRQSIPVENYLQSLQYGSQAAWSNNPDLYLTINNETIPLLLRSRQATSFGTYQMQNEAPKIPLRNFTRLERELKTNALFRENRSYIRILSFDYFGSHRFGDEYLSKILEDHEFPPGYSFEKMEQNIWMSKTKKQYGLVILILVLIFVITAATFESVRLPFFIILIIPLSFIGVFITFSWGGFYFDQGGYAAFILLAGIVVNAAIFILNDAKHYAFGQWNRNVVKACSRKFLPVLLTIVSTCMGLIPFLVDGQKEVFWFSFAIGVIGGLLFSVLLVFLVFPVLLMRKI